MPKAPRKPPPRRSVIAQAIDQATRGPALRPGGAVAKAKKEAQAKLAAVKDRPPPRQDKRS